MDIHQNKLDMIIKKYVLPLISIFCFLFIFNESNAQDNHIEFNFKKLSTEHGLSNSIVYGVLQDRKGYMWFSTQDGGVNRFDGYNFKIFRHNPENPFSISSNNTNYILEDKKGNIWISTWGNGLAKYDPKTERFKTYKYEKKCKNCISSNKIQFIFEDNQYLWLGTGDGGLNCIDTKNDIIENFKQDKKNPNSISNNRVWGIVKDKKNTLWIATSNGLNSFEPSSKKFTVYYNPTNNTNELSDNTIRAITIDKNNILWLGTNHGLEKFNPETKKFIHLALYEDTKENILNNKINAVFIDKDEILWIGSQGGLVRIEPKTEKRSYFVNIPNNPNSISYNDVRFIMQDKTGLIWLGTRGGGVNYFDPNGNNFSSFTSNIIDKFSISGKHVSSLATDKEGRIWIGTDNGGVDLYDQSLQTMQHFNKNSTFGKLNSNYILTIGIDSLDRAWISSNETGIVILDHKTGKVTPVNKSNSEKKGLDNNDIYVIYKDYKNNMWLGSKQDLFCYDFKTDHFTKYKTDPNNPNSLSDSRILSISGDDQHHIWIGTDNGLNMFTYESNCFKRFEHSSKKSNTINSNRIYSIFQDNAKNLWIGTEFGLNLFDPRTGTFKSFNEKNGLAGSAVVSITEDDKHNLWIATTSGLTKLKYPELIFQNYYYRDGLLSNEFLIGSCTKNKLGYIFFGNSEGLNYFKPEQIKTSANAPQLAFTDFLLFDKQQTPETSKVLHKTISYTDTIYLSHEDFVFSFEFTAFDYQSPLQCIYSYKMDGFDKNWITTNRRFATYTTLPDGKYIFKVKAANGKGMWNKEGIKVVVIIQPPFWKTWWFYSICIIVGIASVFGFIKVRTRILEQEKIKLEKTVTERTEEIVKQKDEIEAQRDWANKQRSEITSSIQYARRIQGAILPPIEYLNVFLEDFFIFYKPKDIVSGDFYYAEEVEGKIIIAVADCTGHGVPGAFMSLLGISFLTEIISKLHHELEHGIIDDIHAGYLLDCLRSKLVTSLHQSGKLGNTKDGMDIALLVIDKKKKQIEFAGANNPIVVASNGVLTHYRADKMPIGYRPNSNQNFSNQIIELIENDIVYLFTDGYLDQFGGPKGRKFLTKNFNTLLEEANNLDFIQQKESIQNTFFNWKGSNLQVDDILVMGIKII